MMAHLFTHFTVSLFCGTRRPPAAERGSSSSIAQHSTAHTQHTTIMSSSKLWNRGSTTTTAGGALWHREVPGRSASTSSSLAAPTSSSSLPLQQQQQQQQQQQASSKHHRAQKSKLPTWLISILFKAEKRHLRIFIMLVAICISFWISHCIVSTWPTSTPGNAAFVSNNKNQNYQRHRRDASQHNSFVVPENTMMIRLDDLVNHGGLPALWPDHRQGKRRDFGGIDNLRIMQDDALPRRLHYHVEEHVNNYMKPGAGDDEVDWCVRFAFAFSRL
jgi:hypothetical protein